MGKITVIGSSNTDMVVSADRLPKPGESVIGNGFMMAGGGKGANQAVAVARMGHKVTFVAAIGRDIFGDEAAARYREYGIDTSFMVRKDTPSGVALITVDRHAQNSIAVALGANGELEPEDVAPALEDIAPGDIVLLQLEIPMHTVEEVVRIAHGKGARIVLNPAPAAHLSKEVLERLYVITPNQTEAEFITGIKVMDMESAGEASERLRAAGVRNVVITMGEKGAFLDEDGVCSMTRAFRVEAVDTTAAGDVYNGAMCVGLSEGMTLAGALEFAAKASALSVTRKGAQPSIPTRQEVDGFSDHNLKPI